MYRSLGCVHFLILPRTDSTHFWICWAVILFLPLPISRLPFEMLNFFLLRFCLQEPRGRFSGALASFESWELAMALSLTPAICLAPSPHSHSHSYTLMFVFCRLPLTQLGLSVCVRHSSPLIECPALSHILSFNFVVARLLYFLWRKIKFSPPNEISFMNFLLFFRI